MAASRKAVVTKTPGSKATVVNYGQARSAQAKAGSKNKLKKKKKNR